MRLIDADAVIDVIFKKCDEYDFEDDYCSGVMDGLGKAIKLVDEQPVVEPAMRGKWVESNAGVMSCSVCKHPAYRDLHSCELFDYCPYCGARMDGDIECD